MKSDFKFKPMLSDVKIKLLPSSIDPFAIDSGWFSIHDKEGLVMRQKAQEDCPLCKEFEKLRHVIEIPFYDIDQRPEIDLPKYMIRLYETDKMYSFVKENNLKYLQKKSETEIQGVPL